VQAFFDRCRPAPQGAFYFPGSPVPQGRASAVGAAASSGLETLEGRRLLTAVNSVTIYNTDTDVAIRDLGDGDTFDYAELGTTQLTLAAKTDSSTASVKFGWDGNSSYRVESAKPFTINGDDDGDLLDFDGLTNGTHTITLRPYSASKATGTAGSEVKMTFTVRNDPWGTTPTTNPAPTPAPTPSAPPSDTGGGGDNEQPTVSLGGTILGTFAGPAYSLLRAKASDPDGNISKVEWYANGEYIGQAISAPYMFAWRDVPPGTYEVKAKAYDNDGGTKTSSGGTIKVVSVSGDKVHVSKEGSDDSGNGSESRPYKTIKRAQSSADAGDTILIHAGTYKETIRLKKSGTSDKPITLKAADGPGSVTIDVDGKEYAAVPDYEGAGKWTTLIGLNFKNAENDTGQTTAAVKTADGWRMIDCHVENVNGAAIGMFGKNVVLVRSGAEDNGCTGIGGSRLSDAMMLDCDSFGNNTGRYSGGYEGGGGKFTKVNGFLVEGYESYDNNGPGIWFDIGNVNVAIRNSKFHDNRNLYRDDGSEKIGGRGVFFEMGGIISDGDDIEVEGPMLVEHCTFWGNDHAGVDVYSTANAIVRDNTFNGDYINLKDGGRDPHHVRDLRIVDNRIKDGYVTADEATADDYRDEDFVINRNVYDVDGDKIIRWDGKSYYKPSDAASSLGFEKDGWLGSF
jgi:hypothetical protein